MMSYNESSSPGVARERGGSEKKPFEPDQDNRRARRCPKRERMRLGAWWISLRREAMNLISEKEPTR